MADETTPTRLSSVPADTALTISGLSADGETLLLADGHGRRFRLPVDDALRAALRTDRPHLARLSAAHELAPRQIQALVREGATAEEIAQDYGLNLEDVRRFEGPILDERQYVAEQAREFHVGIDADSPTLGDLVVDRLAARGVDVTSIQWDAVRPNAGRWQVAVRYSSDDHVISARWECDLQRRGLTALDDAARALSETEIDPAPDAVLIRDTHRGADTDAILADLSARRGVRQPIEWDDDLPDGGSMFGPARIIGHRNAERDQHAAETAPQEGDAQVFSLDHARRGGAPREAASESPAPSETVKPEPAEPSVVAEAEDAEPTTTTGATPATRPSRKGRAQMPSWDEIVFGARPE